MCVAAYTVRTFKPNVDDIDQMLAVQPQPQPQLKARQMLALPSQALAALQLLSS